MRRQSHTYTEPKLVVSTKKDTNMTKKKYNTLKYVYVFQLREDGGVGGWGCAHIDLDGGHSHPMQLMFDAYILI